MHPLSFSKKTNFWQFFDSIFPSLFLSPYLTHPLFTSKPVRIQLRYFLLVSESVVLSACLSLCPSIYLSVFMAVHLYVCPFVCLSLCPSICLLCLSIHLSVCLYVRLLVSICRFTQLLVLTLPYSVSSLPTWCDLRNSKLKIFLRNVKNFYSK